MKSLALLLISVVVANSTQFTDYRLALNLTAEEVQECTAPGLFCESCTTVASCTKTGSTFTKTIVGQCSANEKCVNGACTTASDPICDGIARIEFKCKKVGVFPDPFYCNKYYMCVNDGGTLKRFKNECEEGFGFNIATDLCSIKLINNRCVTGEYPVPLCKKLGESAAVAKKPAEYYTCVQKTVKVNGSMKTVLYPELDECPNAKIFSNNECK
ncbi:peritrophic matrix protein 1-B [Asbolus verrucosus]|uniref:Peritrophic matrix protein 1-B n=1 Tax=Asbolus verrucosus TaxID=1661398 RepID=A0A482VP57_ASBVE|nr:peritrophic matrix protein 1-B [Asbolus verrucosus]